MDIQNCALTPSGRQRLEELTGVMLEDDSESLYVCEPGLTEDQARHAAATEFLNRAKERGGDLSGAEAHHLTAVEYMACAATDWTEDASG